MLMAFCFSIRPTYYVKDIMLIVDRSISDTKFICTLYDVNPIVTGSTLEMHNTYDNTDYVIELPVDSSDYPDRYQEFIIPTSSFSGMPLGQYVYTVKDANGSVTETGSMVIDNKVQTSELYVQDAYVVHSNISTSDDDDFIVYEG
jgi:hypothetical protein